MAVSVVIVDHQSSSTDPTLGGTLADATFNDGDIAVLWVVGYRDSANDPAADPFDAGAGWINAGSISIDPVITRPTLEQTIFVAVLGTDLALDDPFLITADGTYVDSPATDCGWAYVLIRVRSTTGLLAVSMFPSVSGGSNSSTLPGTRGPGPVTLSLPNSTVVTLFAALQDDPPSLAVDETYDQVATEVGNSVAFGLATKFYASSGSSAPMCTWNVDDLSYPSGDATFAVAEGDPPDPEPSTFIGQAFVF